jgi:hypothetical protein
MVRIRDLRLNGFSCWPPEWAGTDRWLGEGGVLRDFRTVGGAGHLRIDVEYQGKIFSGMIPVGKSELPALQRILRNHIGKSLLAIGDLDLNYNN